MEICLLCGKTFEAKLGDALFCSVDCKNKAGDKSQNIEGKGYSGSIIEYFNFKYQFDIKFRTRFINNKIMLEIKEHLELLNDLDIFKNRLIEYNESLGKTHIPKINKIESDVKFLQRRITQLNLCYIQNQYCNNN